MFKELLSIAIIVLIGFVARKRGVLGKREANLLNAVVMKFSLPALIFTSLIKRSLTGVCQAHPLAAPWC